MVIKKLKENKKLLMILVVILGVLVLSGCQSNMNPDGTIKTEKIIYLTTPWGDMLKNDSLITFLFVYPLAQCINFLSKYVNVGIAVALTAILFNLIIFKFTIKSTISAQRMTKLQPELMKIQKKYENRKDQNAQMLQANEIQKLYQKYDINPLSSMVMPFIQLPVLISMLYAVQRAEAVVNGKMFGLSLTTTPKAAFALKSSGGYAFFTIFVLMCIAQFASMQITKWMQAQKKDYKNPNPTSDSTMQVMTYTMLIMVAIWGYTWPTAMSLYWLISSIINTVKTVYIQRRYIDNE